LIRVFAFLIPLAILVAGSVWLADRPGAVSIDWMGWRLETSVPVLLVVLAAAAVVLIVLFRLVVEIISLPGRTLYRLRQRRQRLGYQALTDGLAAAASGESRKAKKLAKRAERLLADPALTAFLAAQSAQLAGDETRARTSYEAMLARPETLALGLRGLLRQAIERRDTVAAVELAGRARMASPADPYPAEILFKLLLAQGRFREASELAREAGRSGAFTDAPRRRAIALRAQAEKASRDGDMRAARDLARRAAKLAPDFPPAAALLADFLAAAGHKRAAGKILARAWTRQPAQDLATQIRTLYPEAAPLDRYQRIERIVSGSPDNRATHLILGEAALEAELWGQARRHLLLAAAQDRPDARTFQLLARLEISEYGNRQAAAAWSEKAAGVPAALDWACASCAGRAPVWSLACPHCGEIASLERTDGEKPRPHPASVMEIPEAPEAASELAPADGNG
jgi:HemY protein